MKLLKAISLLTFTVASVYASGGEANNEITYYGCPKECSAQRNPSCPHFDDDNLPSHFAALSTKLSGYDDFCGNYAVYMMADGSNVETLAKATVVDSCSSCAKYHLDLSEVAFREIREKSKGTGKVIWGIYSKSGSRLAGPFYSSVEGSAKKLGMSSDAFISAFDGNAKSLASSSSSTRSFNSSSSGSVEKKTTSKKIVTTSATRITSKTIAPILTTKVLAPSGIPAKNLPNNTLPAKGLPIGATKNVTASVNPVVAPGVNVPVTSAAKAPQQTQSAKTIEKVINEEKKEEEDDDSTGTTVGLLAVGGGVLGAAGVGLLFMKKKNPSTYEEMKQKFPEAFNNVKRGLSRSATSIKRRVTKRAPKQSADAIYV